MTNQAENNFLHSRNTELQKSAMVQIAVEQTQIHKDQRIPNDPASRIGTYMGKLAGHSLIGDRPTNEEAAQVFDLRRAAQIDKRLTSADKFSDDFVQHRLNHQANAKVELTDERKHRMISAIRSDQRQSLLRWVGYLRSNDASYPTWFRYYVVGGVTKLSRLEEQDADEEKMGEIEHAAHFVARTRTTAAPFPDLNREALAYVYDIVHRKHVLGQPIVGDELFQNLAKTANFGKLYAHALRQATARTEQQKVTDGAWTKYDQVAIELDAKGNPVIGLNAIKLSDSLKGYGTGWCTAGPGTAADQLVEGDFYVYYSEDEKGYNTVPRIAIRMYGEKVAEVRGIEGFQNLETSMVDIAMERLKDLPGGEEYLVRAQDVKRFEKLQKRIAKNPYARLTPADIRFVYELDKKIMTFGYQDEFGYSGDGLSPVGQLKIDYASIYVADQLQVMDAPKELIELVEGTCQRNEIISRGVDGEFTSSESRLIYGVDVGIPDFYFDEMDSEDPRLVEILSGRDFMKDATKMYGTGDHNTIFDNFIEDSCIELVMSNLDLFNNHQYIVEQLVGHDRYAYSLMEELDKFDGISRNWLVEKLLDAGKYEVLLMNLKKLPDVDQSEVATRILNSEHPEVFIKSIKSFSRLNRTVSSRIILAGGAEFVISKLEHFINHTDISKQLIEQGQALAVLKNHNIFKGVDDSALAGALIGTEHEWLLVRNIEKLKNLDPSVIKYLRNKGY